VLLVDTNVLVDVLENDPKWAEWSVGQLRSQAQVHELAINPVIYAELAAAFQSIDELDAAIHDLGIKIEEIPRAALFLAGKAYLKYRRAGGGKSGVLADFFIGAHAAVNRWAILTRDATRYRGYFPTVKLFTP
jgi:predicted nucleic acid-binding protein